MTKLVAFLRRVKRGLKRRLFLPVTVAPTPATLPHPEWMRQRLVARSSEYPLVETGKVYSLMTPVFDPPVEYLEVLSKSIFAQDYVEWEWVLVENGCKNDRVLSLLDELAKHPQVKLVKADAPSGIIGGMRLALTHATGDYVCPVDHDDWLYPDALRVVNHFMQGYNFPKLAYSDEDKLLPNGVAGMPFHKPGWDPLLFLNCCYIAHLGVMHRTSALQAGLYTDAASEGTPDGDAFCRMIAAGHIPVHIPEILYSWRMHETSTALHGVAAKPYVTRSQFHALTRHLERLHLADRFTVKTNPIPGVAGTWRVTSQAKWKKKLTAVVLPGGGNEARREVIRTVKREQQLSRIVVTNGETEELLNRIKSVPGADWLAVVSPKLSISTNDWLDEFLNVAEVHPDCVMAGGMVLDAAGMIRHSGGVFGWNGLLGCPLETQHTRNLEVGYGFGAYQRSVSSVDPRFCIVRKWLLEEVLTSRNIDIEHPMLETYLAAYCRENRLRVAFTPHAVARESRLVRNVRQASSGEVYEFVSRYGAMLVSDPYYSRFAGLTKEHPYQAVVPGQRARILNGVLSTLAGTNGMYEGLLQKGETYPVAQVKQAEEAIRKVA